MKYLFIGMVRFYQMAISPLTGAHCRHQPTCSQYTLEALREWGAWKGVWLGLNRLRKCHPWGTKGYDPVPKKHNHEDGSMCQHHASTPHHNKTNPL
jgi:putative membrane protein insertion efficiency factor